MKWSAVCGESSVRCFQGNAPIIRSLLLFAALSPSLLSAQDWPQHSMERPLPPAVVARPVAAPVPPPSDAIVLFDGRDLSRWKQADSELPAKWKVAHGYMEVVRDAGNIATKQEFGDVQLHVEWATPNPPHGEDQERGNSGVFLMGRYEVQVLDSYQSRTYADGLAAAVFGQFPPLVNASRAPGAWQTFEIVFHRPHFDANGSVTAPARMTVFHNGVLVQDNVNLLGPTSHARRDPYIKHADKLSISLQDHGFPVRFRNVWVRELEK